MSKKELTQREVASMGGKALLKKNGKKYFKKLVAKRWNKK
jgi:hypothetical protein